MSRILGTPRVCPFTHALFFIYYFFIYTNHIKLQTAVTCLFKFADVVAHVGLLLNEDSLAIYFSHVSLLNELCEESFLDINVGKTKELVLDGRKTILLLLFLSR